MQILNIAGYKFIPLNENEMETLRLHFLEQCVYLNLKGTILLSQEGINLTLAGTIPDTQAFMALLKKDLRFTDISFHETYSSTQPFKRLKVKLKNEIITLRKPKANPTKTRAPSISPEILKQWLDEKRDILLFDTRNDYEVRFGTFTGAVHLPIADFSELPSSLNNIQCEKTIVMFCTGGIRCEKAALYLLNEGYSDVYQLNGGILGYFAKVGGAHYEGECFVFDERVSVNTHLQCVETIQCSVCQGPVTKTDQQLATYVPGVSCPACARGSDNVILELN